MQPVKSRATPIADQELCSRLFELTQQCAAAKQIKKGANEATKTLNRGISDLIILAADTKPLEIILHLPLLCEDKNVPYIYVPSKSDLGKMCGTSRNVIACSILKNKNSSMNDKIMAIKDECDRLFANQNLE